jgi:DNA-binding MarR family transcriptional regulator
MRANSQIVPERTRLESRKWVTRKPDPADGRYTLATLTDSGEVVLVEAPPGHVDAVNRLVFDALTQAQARQMGVIAGRTMDAIDAETDLRSELRP